MEWYEMALWPFQLTFMVQAMVIAVLVAVPTALLSHPVPEFPTIRMAKMETTT